MRASDSAPLRSKVVALAAHRTQFAFEATMLPTALLRSLLGVEYFEHVAYSGQRRDESISAGWGTADFSKTLPLKVSA